jgi:hypothetical protein
VGKHTKKHVGVGVEIGGVAGGEIGGVAGKEIGGVAGNETGSVAGNETGSVAGSEIVGVAGSEIGSEGRPTPSEIRTPPMVYPTTSAEPMVASPPAASIATAAAARSRGTDAVMRCGRGRRIT